MRTIKRYMSLWYAVLKLSIISELEYRANFVGKIMADLVWYTAQLSLFEVLFARTNLISGWNHAELRVFMGVLFLVDGLYMILFHENLENFSNKVIKGELDLLLAKPVNSQFMVSCSRVNAPYFVNVFLILFYLHWASHQLETPMTPMSLLATGIAGVSGLAVMYVMRFVFASVSILFTKSDALLQVWYQLYRLATRPDIVYPNWLRIVVFTVVPVGFITSVPARILLGKSTPWLVAISLMVSIGMVYLSHRWWQHLLSRYSSASA
jgi:ABC-2 type transport system permease protein